MKKTVQPPLPPEPLGQFEQLVLTALVLVGDGAYGLKVHAKASELMEKWVNIGSMYLALNRLEEKGMVESWDADPTPGRRGRPRRYFKLTPAGDEALCDSRAKADRISEALADFWGGPRWKPKSAKGKA